MFGLYEATAAPDTFFSIKTLYEAAVKAQLENFQLRVASEGLPQSSPVKTFHLGNCGDYLAVFLNLGTPGEGKE